MKLFVLKLKFSSEGGVEGRREESPSSPEQVDTQVSRAHAWVLRSSPVCS